MTWEKLNDEQLEVLREMYFQSNHNSAAVARNSVSVFGIYLSPETILEYIKFEDLPVTQGGWKGGPAFHSSEVNSLREVDKIIQSYEGAGGNPFTASLRIPFSKEAITAVWENHGREVKGRKRTSEEFNPFVDPFFHR